jgi:hypothetical protein
MRTLLWPVLAIALLACPSTPSEPAAPPGSPVEAGPHAPAVHVVVFKDHRSTVKLSVGDLLELPHDDAFAWGIKFEHESFLEPAPASDAGIERFRAARAGTVRTLVSGDPKICQHSDAACTLAKYSWAVTVQID